MVDLSYITMALWAATIFVPAANAPITVNAAMTLTTCFIASPTFGQARKQHHPIAEPRPAARVEIGGADRRMAPRRLTGIRVRNRRFRSGGEFGYPHRRDQARSAACGPKVSRRERETLQCWD